MLFSFFREAKNIGENFSLEFLIKKGKVGVWFIIYIFDAKCLQVYFFLSRDKFIFGDVISRWEMSFVLKNGCICVCWIGSLVLYVDS